MFRSRLSYQLPSERGAGDKWPWESGAGAPFEPAPAEGEVRGKQGLRKRLRRLGKPDTEAELSQLTCGSFSASCYSVSCQRRGERIRHCGTRQAALRLFVTSAAMPLPQQ